MPLSDPDAVSRRVGRRIAELRRKRELTQEAFAELLDVSVQRVRRVELAQTRLTIQALVGIANALGVRPMVLFTRPRTVAVRTGRPRRPKGP